MKSLPFTCFWWKFYSVPINPVDLYLYQCCWYTFLCFSVPYLWFKKLYVAVSVVMGSNPPSDGWVVLGFVGMPPLAFISSILPLGPSRSEERSLTFLPNGINKTCISSSKLVGVCSKLQSKDMLISNPGGEYHISRVECKLNINFTNLLLLSRVLLRVNLGRPFAIQLSPAMLLLELSVNMRNYGVLVLMGEKNWDFLN